MTNPAILPAVEPHLWAIVQDGFPVDRAAAAAGGADEYAAAVALYNAALPPSSPHRIAWADVEALETVLDRGTFQDEGPSPEGWPSPQLEAAVRGARALAAKLAAILPPRRP